MLKKCISKDWYFSLGGNEYKKIDLPHDYAISKKRSPEGSGNSSNGFYPVSHGTYVKHLTFEKDKHYTLDIDGAYMCTEIIFNENYIARHPHGYTPFLTNLTPHIIENTNKLKINTKPLPASTRWYSGNGIYRDVFLWEGGYIRIEPWDMFISTRSISEKRAEIKLKYTVTADAESDITLRFTVCFNDDTVLIKETKQSVIIGKNENEYNIEVVSPKLWDTENPNIYTLKTEIIEKENLIDTSVNTFGIRTISADAKNGLLLNGKPIKLRGGCIHHDHGVLGAAAFPAAEERKIRLLKEAGFNAVRTAHNPPSLALLECCDKMGIVVMDEAFDVWNKNKCPNDYHIFFEDWWARDISYMVLRDRNHPCVFSYSIGNEIQEIDGTSNAAQWSKRLCSEVKKYDDTKLVTSGIWKGFARRNAEEIDPCDYKEFMKNNYALPTLDDLNNVTEGYEAPLDIVGLNYYYDNYDHEHNMYPERVLWGSETHSVNFYDSWELVKNNNYIIGDFTWTAIDNMGEVGCGRSSWARDGVIHGISHGPYPWRTCFQGDLDLCGYRLPRSYFREAVWIGNKEPRIFVTHPEHFGEGFSGTGWHWYDVSESWTFEDKYIGRPVKVETYTDAEKIVWQINGKTVGESVPIKAIASLNTVYEKGEITAIAYKQGKECSRYTLATTERAAAINITPENKEFKADNRDLCYFNISIVDRHGRIVTAAENELKCIVTGGELLGIFSGNPCNEDEYTSDTCHTYCGKALAVVRTKKTGKVSMNVYSSELASGYACAQAK